MGTKEEIVKMAKKLIRRFMVNIPIRGERRDRICKKNALRREKFEKRKESHLLDVLLDWYHSGFGGWLWWRCMRIAIDRRENSLDVEI